MGRRGVILRPGTRLADERAAAPHAGFHRLSADVDLHASEAPTLRAGAGRAVPVAPPDRCHTTGTSRSPMRRKWLG